MTNTCKSQRLRRRRRLAPGPGLLTGDETMRNARHHPMLLVASSSN